MRKHKFTTLKALAATIPASTINWLLPRICLACTGGEINSSIGSSIDSSTICSSIGSMNSRYPLCLSCYENLPFQVNSCHQCGQSFAAKDDYCGRCLSKPPTFDRCFCPFQYSDPINILVRDFKYHERWELAQPLAQILAREIIAQDLPLPELLIAVPAHISRLRSRGYNQSALLTKQLGKALQLPIALNSLSKTRKTAPQAELTLKQRASNLKGCYQITGKIRAKSVAIVDDVVTTGATAEEIAKTLKRNGVDYVQTWGIAHTV